MSDDAKTPLFDVTITSDRPGSRISDGMAGAYIRNIATRRLAVPTDEAIHKDWTEVYFEPHVAGHDPFVKGAYNGRPWLEMVFRWGKTKEPVEGLDDDGHYVFIEFRGCVWDTVLGPERKRVRDFLHFHPVISARPHKGLPPHKTVDEEDRPEEVQRLKRSAEAGAVGTRVEDL